MGVEDTGAAHHLPHDALAYGAVATGTQMGVANPAAQIWLGAPAGRQEISCGGAKLPPDHQWASESGSGFHGGSGQGRAKGFWFLSMHPE
jgi:hypothetical protein